jgi:putative transposase
MVAYVVEHHHISISRACRVASLPKSMYYYKTRKDDSETITKLQELAGSYPTEGQDLYYGRIRTEGFKWNYKRVRRVYLLLGLNRRRKSRKRLPARVKTPLARPLAPLEMWSIDFMSDVLINGRKFRTLNVIDDYNREAIAIEVAHCMPALHVTSLLERIIVEQGKPKKIRTDNGPEFVSKEFNSWCKANNIEIQYTQPGRPMQNGYIERFNRSFRESILDAYLFENIMQVQILAEEWITDYNSKRPHEALGGKTPLEYKVQWSLSMESTPAELTQY